MSADPFNPKAFRDGSKARARLFYPTVESFTADELAAHLGKSSRLVQQMLSHEMKAGYIVSCGRKGRGLRRYTADREVAKRLDAEAVPKPLSDEGMRRKIGACLGGLSNLESLRVRCTIDPDDTDPCWLWNGTMTGDNHRLPTAQLPGGRTGSVIRWAYQAFKKPLAANFVVWRKCTEERCCNPAHLRAGTRKQWGAWIAETGSWLRAPDRMLANRKMGLARAVVKPEDVAEIAASGESREAAAARLGVHPSTVGKAILRRSVQFPHASIFTMKAAA